MREYVPGVLNGLAGLGVLMISFLIDLRLPIPQDTANLGGFLALLFGMSLVVWATVYIKEAITGEVEPVLEVLVKEGPYRFVRHPVYLGMTIALLGVTILLRSVPGLVGTFVLFLPSEVYRAKLEEKALAQKFGIQWETYRKQTRFMFPYPSKK